MLTSVSGVTGARCLSSTVTVLGNWRPRPAPARPRPRDPLMTRELTDSEALEAAPLARLLSTSARPRIWWRLRKEKWTRLATPSLASAHSAVKGTVMELSRLPYGSS